MNNNCLTCQYNKDPNKSPGGQIKEYNYWICEHINEPIPIKGWLVLKTKRHTEGITGMNSIEANELGKILNTLPKLQKKVCNAAQIYIVCFTELVSHLHIHLIPRHVNETKKGTELFNLIEQVRKDASKAININEIKEIRTSSTVYFGVGAINKINDILKELKKKNINKVLVVTGKKSYKISGA